jgi:hypothetical protein
MFGTKSAWGGSFAGPIALRAAAFGFRNASQASARLARISRSLDTEAIEAAWPERQRGPPRK